MQDMIRVRKTICLFSPELNNDGTVTYWSTSCGVWFLNQDEVPDYDLRMMSPEDQSRILEHFKTFSRRS